MKGWDFFFLIISTNCWCRKIKVALKGRRFTRIPRICLFVNVHTCRGGCIQILYYRSVLILHIHFLNTMCNIFQFPVNPVVQGQRSHLTHVQFQHRQWLATLVIPCTQGVIYEQKQTETACHIKNMHCNKWNEIELYITIISCFIIRSHKCLISVHESFSQASEVILR